MNAAQIASIRLRNQRLLGEAFRQPAEVVRYLGAVQSQDYFGGKWALGLRTKGIADSDVDQAFNEGKILRTHVMRPTWHFVAPEDIHWMLALTAPRVHAVNAPIYRQVSLDPATLKRSDRVIEATLRGSNFLTRAELGAALEKAGVPTKGSLRLGYLMAHAELNGIICSGPRRGKQFTYALIAERAPNPRKLNRKDALIELANRYFTSRGPATLADFSWWSGLTIADGRQAVQNLGSKIESFEVDGRTYWHMGAAPPRSTSPLSACLLPNYDEYFIGFKDRSAILLEIEKAGRRAAMPPINNHVLIVDGQVVGGWQRTVKKDAAIVELDLRTKLTSAASAALDVAIERYGRFVGLPVKTIRRSARKRK